MTDIRKDNFKLAAGVILAAVLWFIMFSPWTAPHVNFWLTMTCAGIILSSYAVWADRNLPAYKIHLGWKDLGLGILIAVVLWGVFWTGDKLSQLMFGFARGQVDLIYAMRDGENPAVISLLLLLIIGPAEEFFWRGYLQRNLSEKWNPNIGFIVTLLLYTMIHLPKMNFMLIMAAMVAGAIWGLLYRFFPERLGALIISHALWDAAVFVWFPIM